MPAPSFSRSERRELAVLGWCGVPAISGSPAVACLIARARTVHSVANELKDLNKTMGKLVVGVQRSGERFGQHCNE